MLIKPNKDGLLFDPTVRMGLASYRKEAFIRTDYRKHTLWFKNHDAIDLYTVDVSDKKKFVLEVHLGKVTHRHYYHSKKVRDDLFQWIIKENNYTKYKKDSE